MTTIVFDLLTRILFSLGNCVLGVLAFGVFYRLGIQNDGFCGRNYYCVALGLLFLGLVGIIFYWIWELA